MRELEGVLDGWKTEGFERVETEKGWEKQKKEKKRNWRASGVGDKLKAKKGEGKNKKAKQGSATGIADRSKKLLPLHSAIISRESPTKERPL